MARTSKCPDCGGDFHALGNKKRCSACSDEAYRIRKNKARRLVTPRNLGKTEKSQTDGERLKRDVESANAASMWKKGYDAEGRK